MTFHRLFATISIAVLCCSPALAQQSGPDPSSAAPAPPVQRKVIVRDVQFRGPGPDSPGGPGRHAELRMGPPGMWWKNADIVQKLSLTADQQKRMDDIFQQSRLQLIDLKANVEKQELLLEPMLSANPPDTNKVLAQIDQVASARAELEKANARMLLNIRGVLSADQWTKLQAEKQEMRQKFMRGPGGPMGPGPTNGFKGRGGPGAPISMLNAPPLPQGGVFILQQRIPDGDELFFSEDDDLDL